MLDSAIAQKSYNFAVDITKLYKDLIMNKKEYILSKQVLRSGTSVGANIKEAFRGYSRKDFFFKMNIALKEAEETEYWLQLLIDSDYIDNEEGKKILDKCKEICKILNSISKKANKDNN